MEQKSQNTHDEKVAAFENAVKQIEISNLEILKTIKDGRGEQLRLPLIDLVVFRKQDFQTQRVYSHGFGQVSYLPKYIRDEITSEFDLIFSQAIS